MRLVFACLAKSIRFGNLTRETNFIMLTIFYMNLVNYYFVYLFSAWDSSDTSITILRSLFGGLYQDYNAYWFNDVGPLIVSTMVFNMFYPAIEFGLYGSLRLLWRCCD